MELILYSQNASYLIVIESVVMICTTEPFAELAFVFSFQRVHLIVIVFLSFQLKW
jgi:hypothetical protein